jgi:hypothetical protein
MRPNKTSPLSDPEVSPHKRQRGKRNRPFKIEGRYIGPKDNTFISQFLGHDWRPVGAYETERARDSAFRTLTTKGDWWHQNHEYRLAPTPPDATGE